MYILYKHIYRYVHIYIYIYVYCIYMNIIFTQIVM